MTLSFSQWLRLGFGGMGLLRLYRQNVPVQQFAGEAKALIADVIPETNTGDAISHTEAIRKIQTGDLTATEQAQFDHASSPNAGGAG